MTRRVALPMLFAAAALPAAAAPPTLEEAKAEENLEKRSKLALEFARHAAKQVSKSYRDGDPETALTTLEAIMEAVKLSEESLDETGKVARKKPKHFKHAEIETRKLVRDLTQVQRGLTFDERAEMQPFIERIEEVNRKLLYDIMQAK